jgi:dihydrofolate synthase/folylpolyglutamate synthase
MTIKFHSYTSAYQYLCKFTDYERLQKVSYKQSTYNLKRMAKLLSSLNNPQDKLRCIHIAGTKGKGSTAMLISQILSLAGYRVGLYTSPHLVDLRERIQVWTPNSRNLISKNDFTNLMNYIVNRIQFAIRLSYRGNLQFTITSPTFFEIMTAMAFLHFLYQKVDLAVIEVGLGGRLDATNLITPLVSVITRIDFDHMDKLGNTIKKIAYEKAGIIKRDIPVVTFRQRTSADKVIKEKAQKESAPLFITPLKRFNLPLFTVSKANLLGEHQSENCSLGLKVIEILNKSGHTNIATRTIKEALSEIKLPARLEIVQDNPMLIIDSAHNTLSIKATLESVRKLKYRNLILIFAMSKDKEVAQIGKLIEDASDILILSRAENPRLIAPEKFLRYLKRDNTEKPNAPLFLIPSYRKALETALLLADKDDLILITGSFYLAGPSRDYFLNNSGPFDSQLKCL